MSLWQGLGVALNALNANKLRTALTMLGMIIGVGAVITLMSVGKGAQATITDRIQSIGTNLLFITPGATQEGGVRMAAGSKANLTIEDAVAIADNVATVTGVAPEATFGGQVVAGSQNYNTRVVGVTPEYESVRNFPVGAGAFISQSDVDGRKLVAVLGSYTAQQLFGEGDPIGERIRVNNVTLTVIGVLAPKGGIALGNQDDMILVPITTLQQRLMRQMTQFGGMGVNTIYVQVSDERLILQTVQAIGEVLREQHRTNQDDFTVTSQQQILETFTAITGLLTLLLGSIAGISLVVGGIGIMNIMLVSVTERTREIGIRKAVGAKRRDILAQFVIEAVTVSLAGGIVGVLLGWGVSRLLPPVVERFAGQALPAVVSPDAVALAVGVSAAVGLFFGIYPATRAARLNPIEALRYE